MVWVLGYGPMSSPTLAEIQDTRERIDDYIVETPVWRWRNREIDEVVGTETQVFLKLELFQHTGTFKPRGALAVMLDLDPQTLARGVTGVSAGNHAIAVAYAARRLGTTAKVVMIETANPARIAACKAYGAELLMAGDAAQAFEKVHQVEQDEHRTLVHPFEGPLTSLGTATVGLELMQQVPDLDAVIVPIGGGGLCSGVAAVVRAAMPGTIGTRLPTVPTQVSTIARFSPPVRALPSPREPNGTMPVQPCSTNHSAWRAKKAWWMDWSCLKGVVMAAITPAQVMLTTWSLPFYTRTPKQRARSEPGHICYGVAPKHHNGDGRCDIPCLPSAA